MAQYRADPAYRAAWIDRTRLARRLGFKGHAALLAYLAKRDRGRCGICHTPVRAKHGPMRPSPDHTVPRSKGGPDTLANLQYSHLACNLSKQAGGGGEQLRFIG